MIYDADYPKKPMCGGNPYYACAYCGITDPQINGQVKNHSKQCEYRLFKEHGTALTHDGYGNTIEAVKETISWKDTTELLQAEGWTVFSQNPLQIKNAQGVILDGKEAQYTVEDIIWDYEN